MSGGNVRMSVRYRHTRRMDEMDGCAHDARTHAHTHALPCASVPWSCAFRATRMQTLRACVHVLSPKRAAGKGGWVGGVNVHETQHTHTHKHGAPRVIWSEGECGSERSQSGVDSGTLAWWPNQVELGYWYNILGDLSVNWKQKHPNKYAALNTLEKNTGTVAERFGLSVFFLLRACSCYSRWWQIVTVMATHKPHEWFVYERMVSRLDGNVHIRTCSITFFERIIIPENRLKNGQPFCITNTSSI